MLDTEGGFRDGAAPDDRVCGEPFEAGGSPKMVWLPPFPDRHQRANICGAKGHINGEGRHDEGYNDRG